MLHKSRTELSDPISYTVIAATTERFKNSRTEPNADQTSLRTKLYGNVRNCPQGSKYLGCNLHINSYHT